MIAKTVRAEIKAMQATGEVPDDWKVSVRTSRYAGGQAINIRVDGVETEEHYEPDYHLTVNRPTPAGSIALARIEEAMESYNYDRSESQTDYFDVYFYGNVSANGTSSKWVGRACPVCVQYRPCDC